LTGPLLSHASNIQQFAIPRHPNLLHFH
jgi:hypothetical protein